MELQRALHSDLAFYMTGFPALAIVGPRQVGKTTIAKSFAKTWKGPSIYLDLESDEDLAKLSDAERYFRERPDTLIVLDEIQRRPDLMVLLRSVIDRDRRNGRFIITGSASPELLTLSSESLAGRIAYLEMHPLHFLETRNFHSFQYLWLNGGFPGIYLQENAELRHQMRIQFIQTYLERELPLLGLSASPVLLRNLIRMITWNNGQMINYSELSRSLGVQVNTVKRYIDFFEHAFLIRRLQPWYENAGKRLVKSPRIYIRDTGLLHALSGVISQDDLDAFPGKGNSWEGFVIQQIAACIKPDVSLHYYRTQDGTELDLVICRGLNPVLGIEIKLSNAPSITKGTTLASHDLGNIPVLVVTHSVMEDYSYSDLIRVTSFERIFFHLGKLGLIRVND